MKEVRDVIEMSGKTVFRDGRSYYKKTGIILGIVLAVTFLAGNVLGVSSSPDLHIDNLTEEYRSWHVGYFDANYVFKQTLLKDDRVTDVVSFDNVGYATLSCIQDTNKPYLFIAGFNEETYEMVPVQLITGRLPKDGSEVLMPSHLLSDINLDCAVGDTLDLAVGLRQDGDDILSQHIPYRPGDELLSVGEDKTYTVVGIYEKPIFEAADAPGYTLITASDRTVLVESISVFASLKEVEEVYHYAEGTAPGADYAVNSKLLQELKDRR